MKLKKKTSMLMIASATAAVVGIAAVSFAAWTGGNHELTADAATGDVYLEGFITKSLENATYVPYDQPANSIKTEGAVTYMSYALEFNVYSDYTIKVSAVTELDFYVQIGEQITKAPTTLDGWTLVKNPTMEEGSEVKHVYTYTPATQPTGNGEQTVYLNIILKSDNYKEDYKAEGNVATFTVTLHDYSNPVTSEADE